MTEEQAKELMELISSFPHCQKGLCMTPATRIASYYADEKKVAEMLSCDRHGGQPVFILKEAELLRASSDLLRDGGYPGWWEDYSGRLDRAVIPFEFELVLVGLRAARGSALTPAATWELYGKLLDEYAAKYRASDALVNAASAARDVAMKLKGR